MRVVGKASSGVHIPVKMGSIPIPAIRRYGGTGDTLALEASAERRGGSNPSGGMS